MSLVKIESKSKIPVYGSMVVYNCFECVLNIVVRISYVCEPIFHLPETVAIECCRGTCINDSSSTFLMRT